MRTKQLSVFIENQPGRLVAMLDVLARNQISIRALSVSETAEFGIVRMILAEPTQGLDALREAGFTTRMDEILSADIPDVPGGLLNSVARPLSDAGINVRYFYAYIEPVTDKAVAVIKTDDLEKAEEVLKSR